MVITRVINNVGKMVVKWVVKCSQYRCLFVIMHQNVYNVYFFFFRILNFETRKKNGFFF